MGLISAPPGLLPHFLLLRQVPGCGEDIRGPLWWPRGQSMGAQNSPQAMPGFSTLCGVGRDLDSVWRTDPHFWRVNLE